MLLKNLLALIPWKQQILVTENGQEFFKGEARKCYIMVDQGDIPIYAWSIASDPMSNTLIIEC